MPRTFRSPRAVIREIIYGPEPVGKAGAAMLQRYSAGQLSGGPLDGYVHYGMKGNPATSFTGWVASPQKFQGAAQLGASKNLSVQKYPALPAASPPEALPSWLQDWTQLEGIIQ